MATLLRGRTMAVKMRLVRRMTRMRMMVGFCLSERLLERMKRVWADMRLPITETKPLIISPDQHRPAERIFSWSWSWSYLRRWEVLPEITAEVTPPTMSWFGLNIAGGTEDPLSCYAVSWPAAELNTKYEEIRIIQISDIPPARPAAREKTKGHPHWFFPLVQTRKFCWTQVFILKSLAWIDWWVWKKTIREFLCYFLPAKYWVKSKQGVVSRQFDISTFHSSPLQW